MTMEVSTSELPLSVAEGCIDLFLYRNEV